MKIDNKYASLLLDSGCIGRDFITEECCKRLNAIKYKLKYPIEVTSIHGTEKATEVVQYGTITIEHEDQTVTIELLPLVVLKHGPTDIILGHNTLREHGVYNRLTRYFGKGTSVVEPPAVKESSKSPQPACQRGHVATASPLRTNPPMGDDKLRFVHISELIPTEHDNDPTDELLPTQDTYAGNEQGSEELKFTIKGTEADKRKIAEIIHKWRHIFAKRLPQEPAKVTPMTIEVDYEAYKADRRSREPTRAQSAARKMAIKKWILQAIADNIIRPSTATAWSQLMLTPKPNGTWRFNIDYRALNKHTKAMRAPIPNIRKLLAKIGAHQPKFFAKMDLTMGFYQTPMDESSRQYTAFNCDEGLFEFVRVSMGLINSPWYFQGVMEREVFMHLQSLQMMAIYIDDLLTWASNIEELCTNLDKIFEALSQKGMTLNPEKCEFGMTEVEFVGHLIDENGITFTEDKKKQVADMPLPSTKGDLKAFLGLAGYFRLHVQNMATLSQPLNNMLEGYDKKTSVQKLVWTAELTQMYYDLRSAVVNCRKLFYVHETLPIRVYTDASDYGIGAYLCQVMADGSEIPIEFISKTLTKAERKWSTYEKEAYAIFYSLRKWEHLLRDVRFTLFTDHKNLTYLTKDPSPKVMRWRMAVQDYDFNIAYIPGEENIIADGFSRLCPRTNEAEGEGGEEAGSAPATIAALITRSDEIIE